MCGRYVLALRPEDLSRRLSSLGLLVDEDLTEEERFPDSTDQNETDDQEGGIPVRGTQGSGIRPSYNIAPGYMEPVYLATQKGGKTVRQLKLMKWGLIPSWSKASPDYRTLLKTINCRDDSLLENKGMWSSMKHKKRCIVLAEGFYEWLSKGGRKIPYYIKRKDGGLLTFAGLWDCVAYESQKPLFTYTIITTNSNDKLKFLHDRMPVILDPPSIQKWLDTKKQQWDKELQGVLQPWTGELEVYPVSSEVSKAGKSSPSYIVPLDEKPGTITQLFWRQAAEMAAKEEKPKPEEVKIEAETYDGTVFKQESFGDPAFTKVGEHEVKRELDSASPTIGVDKSSTDLKQEQTTTATPRKRLKTSITPLKSNPARTARNKQGLSSGKGNAKITSFFGNPK